MTLDEKRFQTTESKSDQIRDKIWIMPQEMRDLRTVLERDFREVATAVFPGEQHSILSALAWDGPLFVLMMNSWLEMNVEFDTRRTQAICRQYLSKLETMR